MHARTAALLATVLTAAVARCAHGLELERAGHVSGDYVRHVALVGDLVIRATQDELGAGKLLLHDLSDPARPRLVKAFRLRHFAYSMAASPTLAVAGGDGLRLIGIRDPQAPVDYATSSLSRNPFGLALVGELLYAADLNEGLVVIDVSDPAAPDVVGRCSLPAGNLGLEVDSGLALVWDWYSRLHVIDISDPAAPTEVGMWECDGSVDDVALFRRVAYIASGVELRVLDLSAPSSPQEYGPYWFDRTPTRLVLDRLGAAAYVELDWPAGIARLNLEDPLWPRLVGFLPLEWSPRGISLWGMRLLAAGSEGQLLGLDTSTLEVTFDYPGVSPSLAARQVAVASGRAYVNSGPDYAGTAQEVAVVDLRDLTAPVKVAAAPVTQALAEVLTADGWLYGLFPEGASLATYDLTDPDAPTPAGLLTYPGSVHGVAVGCGRAYLVADGALRVLDVSDPAAPVEVGASEPIADGGAMRVTASRTHAFVATCCRLLVYDVSNPAQPMLVGETGLPSSPVAMALSGSVLFLAMGQAGALAVDVSDPAHPQAMRHYDVPVTSMLAWGSVLFTDDRPIGLNDLPDALPTGDEAAVASKLAVWRDALLKAEGSRGLQIYKVITQLPDIEPGFWALDAIERCVDNKIVAGYPDGLYHPDALVTRDQMAVYLARALAGGDDQVPSGPATPSFADVPPNHWAYSYVEFVAGKDVVRGFGDGTYRPALPLNRADMAAYLARAIAGGDVPDPGCGQPSFPDVPCDHWARPYMEYLDAWGVVTGYGDGLYRPDDPCRRDQMAVYLTRGFDLPSTW